MENGDVGAGPLESYVGEKNALGLHVVQCTDAMSRQSIDQYPDRSQTGRTGRNIELFLRLPKLALLVRL